MGVYRPHKRSQDFLWGCTFLPPPKKLITFLVVQNRLKLLNYLLPPSRSTQFPKNMDSCSAWEVHALSGVHLQIKSPVNLATIFFSALGVPVHPEHPAWLRL